MDFNKIGNCRGCDKSPEGENFRGRKGEYTTQGFSQNDWWISISHYINSFNKEDFEEDRIDYLFCKECHKKHNEVVDSILEEFI